MAWSTGTSCQLISVLNQACLLMLFPTITTIIEHLAEQSLEDARKVASGAHCAAYGNINLGYSILIEQTANTLNKVQSGTFGVIYQLLHAPHNQMRLAPLIHHLHNSKPLTIQDLRPSHESLWSFNADCYQLCQDSYQIQQLLFSIS